MRQHRYCRFLWIPLSMMLAGALARCSDDTTGASPEVGPGSDLAGAHDAGPAADVDTGHDLGQGSDQSTAADTTPAADAAPVADAAPAVSCTSNGNECTNMAGLACECCGAMGPMPICLCSKACAVDTDCQGSGLPLCNKAPGLDSGICTPTGFNCCWFCQ